MVGTVSTSVSSSNSNAKPSRGRPKTRRVLVITCVFLSLALLGTLVGIKGRVSGSEFAPSHFQTREFSFYEIPFLHIQITPIKRKNTTGAIARQLRAKSWISVPRGNPPSVWHIVRLWRGPSNTTAVASLLTEQLRVGQGSGGFWKNWNSEHPNRASVLWPQVQELAERELYVLIPELMLLARSLPGDDSPNALSDAIDQWLVDQYSGLVTDFRDANRLMLADELLTEALNDYPDSPQLNELKAPPN